MTNLPTHMYETLVTRSKYFESKYVPPSYSSNVPISYFKLSLKVIPEFNFLNIVMFLVLAMAKNKFLQ